MHDELGPQLAAILASHNLPDAEDGPLWEDRFEDFLEWRQTRLAQELITVTSPKG